MVGKLLSFLKRSLFRGELLVFGRVHYHNLPSQPRIPPNSCFNHIQSTNAKTKSDKRIVLKNIFLENLVYHFFRQQWLVLGVKLMEINSNLFSRLIFSVFLHTKKYRSRSHSNVVFQWVFREKPRFQSVIEVRPPYQSGFVHPLEDVAPGFDVHVPLGAPPWCRTGGSFNGFWLKMQKKEKSFLIGRP